MSKRFECFGLTERIAVVTGSSQGVGQTLAVKLTEGGLHVVLASRNRP